MKIAYITAGAGHMYCGSCIHDNTLAAALQRKGHDVALIPTYTPIRTDEDDVSLNRVFYGGINVYLQEKLAIFRHTPCIFDNLLNSPKLLNWISNITSGTNAKDLGAVTVSVLQGERGHQKKELDKLVKWLKESFNPELVQLTNSMFVGMAKELKRQLNVPIICALQGEDIFLESLVEPHKTQALQILQDRVVDVDGFIATSQYYANFMAEYLNISMQRIHVVKLGLNLQGHAIEQFNQDRNPFIIGYLARICPEKGLHLLVEAFYQLRQKLGPDKIQLKIAGYLGKRDLKYFENIRNQIDAWSLNGDVEYIGEVDRLEKIIFLNSLHVLSVPTTYKEPKGLFVLEALANGVPVVQPRHGSFPELIEATGGGILVEPEKPDALAEGIYSLMKDPEYREKLGHQGKQSVHQLFSDEIMAEATLEVYKQYL
ncbi:MAG: glycosyltransferase family 4 protein [bacterium]